MDEQRSPARAGSDKPLTDLTDDELREIVLCDWVQLTSILSHEQPSLLLSRMLRLELERGVDARATFVERLRGALARSRSREGTDAHVRVATSLLEGTVPTWRDLQELGLEEHDIHKLQSTLKQIFVP